MPIHDWTRGFTGLFHCFHCSWVCEISKRLNNGGLPADYYVLAEQRGRRPEPGEATGPPDIPHVLGPEPFPDTLHSIYRDPPDVRFKAWAESYDYARKRRTLVVRHASDERVVALIEILSPGDKVGRQAARSLVEKMHAALLQGVHLLVIDLHPPGPSAPQGVHAAFWAELEGEPCEVASDKPLTLVAYSAGPPTAAYLEPVAVGDVLPDMPLFLEAEYYVNVPLEATYQAAWEGVPRRWRAVLEVPPS